MFTEKVNKFVLSANDGKRIQSINSMEIYAYETSKDLICKKEKTRIEYNNLIYLHKKIINFDDVTEFITEFIISSNKAPTRD